MTESGSTDFHHQGQSFHFELLPECSVSRHLSTQGTFYELPFLEAIGAVMPAETVAFDIGAHIGNHTVYFAKVLGWRVFAFEPNPDAFAKLTANVERNDLGDRVTCFQVALSDAPGHVRMARTEPTDAGTVSVLTGDGGAGSHIEAEAATLDSYAHLGTPGPTLVKIDVEGYEKQVIEGGADFIRRLSPHLTTEVQSIAEFETLLESLKESHHPSRIFNPTPTILWEPSSGTGADEPAPDVIRYAIRAQIAYNESHRRNLRTHRELEAVEAVLEDGRGPQPTERDRVGLMRIRDQLAASEDIQRLTGKRLLIEAVGDVDVPGAALSALARGVDVVGISDSDPRRIEMSRYVDGHLTTRRIITSPMENDHLSAAQISLFVESADTSLSRVDAAAVIGGESAPELADTVIDLLGIPYIHVALDPVYLSRRLPRTIGAAACFVSSPNQIRDWDTSQIVPAAVLDPEDPLSLGGGISQALPKRRPQPRSRETDHRMLLVSYYSRPVKTVAIQRLAYWKDHLSSIAESMGLSLSVDWLSATNRAVPEDGMIHVADRGPLHLDQAEWERLGELKALGLDVIGATWSHYVRESLSKFEHTYDVVLISGNPFYYFDLARSFREAWGCTVVLDFRDPWARQERFKYSIEQRAKLIELEAELVGHADWVVSVNQECLDSIAPTVEVPRLIVANGYDETIVDSVPAHEPDGAAGDDRIKLVYAGTVYATLPLDNLLDALSEERHEFVHFGRDYSKTQAVRTHPVAVAGGLVAYEDLIAHLKGSDAGIIMTTGEPTMSTTKIFDYVACDLDIIIVTRGRPRTGLLHELTSEMDAVHWVEDDPGQLKDFFRSYRPDRRQRVEKDVYSRREQARRLLETLYMANAVVS